MVILSLCLINWQPSYEDVWGSGGISQFLTSGLDWDEWSAWSPGCYTSWERAPCTHLIWDWEGFRASLDDVGYRKLSWRESNSCRLVWNVNIITCRGYARRLWRVLVRMIGFSSALVTVSLLITFEYSAIVISILNNSLLHTHTSPLMVMQVKQRNQRFKSLQILYINIAVAIFHRELRTLSFRTQNWTLA
jgi:hypothetical protein